MSPEFCLRWNNHRPNLVNVFKELLHHEVLVDVTLAAEGQFIHAHRLVLSACSLYFKELFAVNPCQHPIVILKDFHIADLKTVVEFIYQGEVNVAQERLPNVLKTAESLRIKGLAENPRSYEDYQPQQPLQLQQPLQQTSNSAAKPRLGSQQQSSSLSDSLEQQSVEEEDAPPDSPHSPAPPPHKRKRGHAYDTDHAILGLAGEGEGVRVKEEPVSGNGHGRRSTPLTSDASLSGATGEGEGANNRDSPPDKNEGVGGTGGNSSPRSASPSVTPSLSNVSLAPGDSVPALTPPDTSAALSQQQGRNRRAVLQRQPGIIRDGSSSLGSVGKRVSKEEAADDDSASEYSAQGNLSVSAISSSYDSSVSVETVVSSVSAFTDAEIPIHGTSSSLLQVPAMVLSSPRETGPLPKQVSQPEFSESRSVVHQYGQHPMMSRSVGSIGSPGSSTGYIHNPTTSSSQHLQVMQVFLKQPQQQQQSRGSTLGSELSLGTGPVNLRPIQPKPALEGVLQGRSVKEEISGLYQRKETTYQTPLIRLTPSDDVSSLSVSGPPSRLPRAVSEEPLASRQLHTSMDLLGPGPLIQSVSEDAGMDSGSRMVPQTTSSSSSSPASSSFGVSSHMSSYSPLSSLPPASGHRLALRDGPALGCNFCWNSTDDHGRIQRRKTKYHCPECRTNLCIVPCYQKYHKQMERADDTDKQITKMLTKSSL